VESGRSDFGPAAAFVFFSALTAEPQRAQRTGRGRTWAYALPAAVASKGVQVGHVAIGARLWRQPGATPEAVAPLYWEIYTQRDLVEKVFLLEAASGQSTRPA